MINHMARSSLRPNSASRVRVLIVDDSPLMRRMLTEMLQSDAEIEVVGAADDAYRAREMIKALNPDVLTLDVEMPRMDGIQFLRNLMRLRPMPVVMVSSLTQAGADVTLTALQLGAIDFVSKPLGDLERTFQTYANELVEKVKIASKASIRADGGAVGGLVARDGGGHRGSEEAHTLTRRDSIIAIGASTGGTEAIKEVLLSLPAQTPGIVVAQHIPEQFSGSFARRLDSICPQTVSEATDGQQIEPSHVYIARGGKHLRVERQGPRFICRLSDSDPVNRHRPSVCVLFDSVASTYGRNAIGVILTGMGDDGAEGIRRMREAGAFTVAQDEASSVVWGMPGQAVKRGGISAVLPLGQIGERISKTFADA
ncbi:MAG: chemotaxis response regulator protein-glutamate methylesterase [Thiotrichales bacterium]